MKDWHLDQNVRIDNRRVAGIIVRDKEILMMKRRFEGYDYIVFPGGHIRKDEDEIVCLKREIKEEMSIKVKNIRKVFEFLDFEKDNYDIYYICEYASGEVELGGEEKEKNNPDNYYKPMWVKFEEFSKLNVLPKFAKEWVEETLF